jgi:hypothetical protein
VIGSYTATFRSGAMNAKSILIGGLCATTLIAVAIWLAVGYQGRLGLEEENQGLRQQLDQMAELVTENERLSNLVAQASQSQPQSEDQMRELLRLRGEVNLLRQQGNAAGTSPNRNAQSGAAAQPAAATANYWPRNSWAPVGYATPDAAIQSALYAASKGDVKGFLGGITDEVQKTLELGPDGNSSGGLLAAMAAETAKLKAVRVLGREAQADDTIVVTAAFDEENGTATRKLLVKKVGGEWKFSGYMQ